MSSDSTCVCTSTLPGQCDALAQNLITLIPTLNNLFSANYTPKSLSDAVWAAQGAPPVNSCQTQAVIVDVAPALNAATAPNRTQWAQAAMLWNFAQSQNTAALETMQEFVADAPWRDLSQADGPVSDASNTFIVSSIGFKFDFAAQTVTAPSVTFVTNGNPSSAQVAQVDSTASTALDRMYSFALGVCVCTDTEVLHADHSQHHLHNVSNHCRAIGLAPSVKILPTCQHSYLPSAHHQSCCPLTPQRRLETLSSPAC